MNISNYFLFIILFATSCRSQTLPEHLRTSYEPLNERLASMVTIDDYSIPPAEVQNLTNPILLDARELEEYEVSHIPDAQHIGYRNPNFDLLDDLNKDRPVVVYCTIGYRSERVARQLRDRGFSEVYNLYGSVYAWLLAGLNLQTLDGEVTQKVHAYNRRWATYLPDNFEKVY
ncbi:MAG: rhodanese-like domain-containing protein [Bacteroidota bacterium]